MSRLVCAGCGAEVDEPLVWRCAKAGSGDDVDHVLTRGRALADVEFPFEGDPNPFLRFRELLVAAEGVDPERWERLVGELVPDLAATPLVRADGLAGELWVKDETVNPAGSHKVRHLANVALHLAAHRGADDDPPRLVIASCGNAAAAAALLAERAGWPLTAFVPEDVAPEDEARVGAHGAFLSRCPRGDEPGDPCWRAMLGAAARGSVPFSVQGRANAYVVEGGATIAWEVVAADGPEPERPFEDVFVQVGGGALATGIAQGFREALALGAVTRRPRIFPVQTAGGHPFERAWRVLARELAGDEPESDAALAAWLEEHAEDPPVANGVARAAWRRSRYMWPWEERPHGVADGILDDETYDWHALLAATIETGGRPLVVTDAEVLHAQALLAEHTGVAASATGAASLAGWIAAGDPERRSLVLATGAAR